MALLLLVVALSVITVFPIISEAQSEQKTFVTHSGAVVQTSGEIIDPLYTVSTVEFDPDEFLRNFEYGRISISESGQTIRDYTIIAEDDKIQEISPGVFYNVWTFNGTLLVSTVVVLSFLGLYYSGEKLVKKADSSKLTKPVAIALMISIGIGLHNFGEGLAIGAAVGLGSIAFSTFLIVGFALHNTTEGIAIAAPMSRGKLMIGKLAAMGMIAGAPAIFGAWVGGFVYSPFTSVIFLAVGAGAIFQVIVILMKWLREEGDKNFSSAPVVSGFAVGMLVMYLTSILV